MVLKGRKTLFEVYMKELTISGSCGTYKTTSLLILASYEIKSNPNASCTLVSTEETRLDLIQHAESLGLNIDTLFIFHNPTMDELIEHFSGITEQTFLYMDYDVELPEKLTQLITRLIKTKNIRRKSQKS